MSSFNASYGYLEEIQRAIKKGWDINKIAKDIEESLQILLLLGLPTYFSHHNKAEQVNRFLKEIEYVTNNVIKSLNFQISCNFFPHIHDSNEFNIRIHSYPGDGDNLINFNLRIRFH